LPLRSVSSRKERTSWRASRSRRTGRGTSGPISRPWPGVSGLPVTRSPAGCRASSSHPSSAAWLPCPTSAASTTATSDERRRPGRSLSPQAAKSKRNLRSRRFCRRQCCQRPLTVSSRTHHATVMGRLDHRHDRRGLKRRDRVLANDNTRPVRRLRSRSARSGHLRSGRLRSPEWRGRLDPSCLWEEGRPVWVHPIHRVPGDVDIQIEPAPDLIGSLFVQLPICGS